MWGNVGGRYLCEARYEGVRVGRGEWVCEIRCESGSWV